MEQKKVKIVGLSVNKQLGILKACEMQFDENNHLNIIKGGVGEGKTTAQQALKLGTQGSKTLVDKNLYGEIDIETQLLDGDQKVFVGAKSDKTGKLQYVLYTKDAEGKKVKEPVIDGVKATPAKYLEMLQTELTWSMDELTSENPNVQKKILLKLYQAELEKVGVVFDKKLSTYEDSILHKIDKAEEHRNYCDAIRKTKGGIADDLKAQGFDPERPETIPQRVDIEVLRSRIIELERQKATAGSEAKQKRDSELHSLQLKASELTQFCMNWNNNQIHEFNQSHANWKQATEYNVDVKNKMFDIVNDIVLLTNETTATTVKEILTENITLKDAGVEPQQPKTIKISDGKVLDQDCTDLPAQVKEIMDIRKKYIKLHDAPLPVSDMSAIDNEIQSINMSIQNGSEFNRINDAVDSFYEWQAANQKVVELKHEYVQMLAKVDTGVEGLQIVPDKDDIFLMYNGAYDTAYFNNPEMEMRKLSAYSGTQKPVICLLIQAQLLSKRAKALRYMFIDNVPIDKKTRVLFEKMCTDLDLTVFLNITGDFEQNGLQDGEILIEGGEVICGTN